MDATLQTYDIVVRATENFAKLDIVADSLAVFETNSPFDLTDEQSFLFRGIDRACRLNVKKPGFQFRKMKVMRPAGVTGDIVIKFAVGDGVEFIDGRLQYTSNNTIKDPSFAVTAVRGPVRGRFVPKFVAAKNLVGAAQYTPDFAAAPKITNGSAAVINLLAPQSEQVSRRVVKLLTGAAAKVGVKAGDLTVPGRYFDLSTANPERTIDGGENLFGSATEDCTLSVYEVIETTSAIPDFTAFDAAKVVSPADLLLFPPGTLSGAVSFVFVGPGSLNSKAWQGPLASSAIWTAKGHTSGTNYEDTFTASFSGITSAEAGSVMGDGYSTTGNVRTDATYLKLFLGTNFAPGRISTSTGQTFMVPMIAGGYPSPNVVFRVCFPWDNSPPYFEQSTTGPAGAWVRNS